jgi:hypothetical protein
MLQRLIAMLTYCRPDGGIGERAFIRRYVIPLGARKDSFGNFMLDIAPPGQDAPRIMFTCHTDSVHNATSDGRQSVKVANGIISLPPQASNCLGADDATGAYIMSRMIEAGVPGRYVFHRAEESGCRGSHFIAEETPDVWRGIDAVVSFDRAGYSDVITHQLGRRTASNTFASALAGYLGAIDGREEYAPDTGGVYTDSESYADYVPECTNLSVGYFAQHSRNEIQDGRFAVALAERCITLPWHSLPIARTPEPDRYDWRGYGSSVDLTGEYEDAPYTINSYVQCVWCGDWQDALDGTLSEMRKGGILCAPCARAARSDGYNTFPYIFDGDDNDGHTTRGGY